MTAIKSDVGGSQPSGAIPNTPGAVPKSDVRQALEWLAGQITSTAASLTALTAVAQYTADASFALGQVVRGEARRARLAARQADERAAMAAQSAVVSIGGLNRLRIRVSDARITAEEARARATQALAMSRELRRRIASDQIVLTAQVYN